MPEGFLTSLVSHWIARIENFKKLKALTTELLESGCQLLLLRYLMALLRSLRWLVSEARWMTVRFEPTSIWPTFQLLQQYFLPQLYTEIKSKIRMKVCQRRKILREYHMKINTSATSSFVKWSMLNMVDTCPDSQISTFKWSSGIISLPFLNLIKNYIKI